MSASSPPIVRPIIANPTPMMQQYLAAKDAHPDAMLLFRMGDFYELFFDDAVEASRILELTLTSRNKKDDHPIPMAGVPYHALDTYLPRLVSAGKKVAICEQVEDPRQAKGIVKRAVTRVVTPGVILDASALDQRVPNFLAAVFRAGAPGAIRRGEVGLAWVDVSTGERRGARVPTIARALEELARVEPREVLFEAGDDSVADAVRSAVAGVTLSPVARPAHADSPKSAALSTAAEMLADYVGETRAERDYLIRDLEVVEVDQTMRLGATTVRNLELLRTMADGKRRGSLLWVLDETETAMGSRLLRRWLLYPSRDLKQIVSRHDRVQALHDAPLVRASLTDLLDGVYDLERLVGRVTACTASPRDLVALAQSLGSVPALADGLREIDAPVLDALADTLDPVDAASTAITTALVDAPPITLKDGGVIREGHHPELDELIGIAREGKAWFQRYAETLREATGITSLKIKFNNVFGYFIEVTKANLHLVPDDWHRKQTLANAERYYTLELKEREEKVLGADERRLALEASLFEAVRATVAAHGARIQATATRIAEVDVLVALAEVAQSRGWVRPEMTERPTLSIDQGRHPVIEAILPAGTFVPNDLELDSDAGRMMIITGPNMAGKSTVMRQAALIVLLAQLGSFVPANRATIGLTDRIFTRVGASDNLAQGQSTFMVEMTETAEILTEATRASLVILDEIGRGTSTFDGVSIAWAVAEHLHDTIGARTLFATHYHELTALADTRDGVVNTSIAVKEWRDEIVFLRRLVPGGTNRSYGIQVGRLAGLPEAVVSRAKEVLDNLEATALDADSRPRIARGGSASPNNWQLDLFAPPPSEAKLTERMAQVDPDALTPRAALDLLYELHSMLEPPS